jgi:Xaa-Pro aminopeptidase
VTGVARYAERRRRAVEALGGAGLDGLVVTPGPDLRYLTGYDALPLERLTMLRLTPHADPVMLVPGLERAAAAAAEGIEGIELTTWADGDDVYVAAAPLLGPNRYAVSDRMWSVHLLGFQSAVPDATFVATSRGLPPLRAVKDPDEIEALARAGAAADLVFASIVTSPFAGRPERDVANELGELLRANGHETVDFAIVGSGPNGASPHHDAGDRRIRPGEAVVLDFGGFAGGYGSDITRTVVVGEPPAGFDEVYEIVRRAQQAAFEAVRPGIACEDVDAAARAVIEQAGFGERFIHRTGHGIGLETHEDPYIVEGNRMPLREGMTFSIEPGIYLEDRFGVRIEDIVAVTADGARRLNEAPRELQIVE